MTQLESVQTKMISAADDDEWQIEIESDPKSHEKLITLWLLTPDRERHHFLTICDRCLPGLIRAIHEAVAELYRTA